MSVRFVGAVCVATTMLLTSPLPASQASAAGTTPVARVAELDPTVVFNFPGAAIYVEPSQSWMLPIGINEDVGGRPALLQKRVGSRWATVKRTHAARGRLQFRVQEKKGGTYSYRVVVPSHGGFEARTTKPQTVHVEPISDANRQFFVPTRIAGSFTGSTLAWGAEVMSWSGTVAFDLSPPYEQGGLSSEAYYRPTAAAVTWRVDYRDWRDCHFEGSGTLGLPDIGYEELNGTPLESVAPLGRPDEYSFSLTHQWDQPLLVGTVTCPGAAPVRQEFTNSMGNLFETNRGTAFDSNLRLEYVDGYPPAGWVRLVGRTDPADPSVDTGVNTWDLVGSGRSPLLRGRG